MHACEFDIRPAAVARWCAAAIALLVAAHAASQTLRFVFDKPYQMGLAQEVYLGSEASIPNWFSTVLILACGAALLAIAHAKRGRPFHRHWLALGVIFVAMSLDESAALHDLSAPFFYGVFTWLARHAGGPFVALTAKPGYAWMVPGVIFCVAVGISYLPFLSALPARTRRGFVGSGIVYVAGAVGFEFLGGWYSGTWGSKNPIFVSLLTCEETLEMIGMTLFLYALVSYLAAEVGELRLRIAAQPAPARNRATVPARAVEAAARAGTRS